MATSEAQKKAVRKYQSGMKRIPLDVTLSEYEKIKDAAIERNESVNGFIKKAINLRIGIAMLDILATDKNVSIIPALFDHKGETGYYSVVPYDSDDVITGTNGLNVEQLYDFLENYTPEDKPLPAD